MRRFARDYSLGLVLFTLFIASWALQTWSGWREFVSTQHAHEANARWFGNDGFLWVWLRATFENWQSEFLQLFAMVSLTSILIFKGSPESRDGDDEIKAKLEQLSAQLSALIAQNQSRESPKIEQA